MLVEYDDGRQAVILFPRRLRTAARLLTELAFTVPGIERAGIHHGKASQASAGVPRSLGYRPSASSQAPPPAPAGHGIGCTWRITRDEWLNAKG